MVDGKLKLDTGRGKDLQRTLRTTIVITKGLSSNPGPFGIFHAGRTV